MQEFWDGLREDPWPIWLAIAMVLGVLELLSLELTLLMLASGALVGMLAALLGVGVAWQILAAAASSLALLAFVRPTVVKRLQGGPDLKQGFDALIGEEGFAVAEVTAHAGQIKVAGEIWTARPYDDTAVIPVGARVRVFEIRGATAYVDEIPALGT